MKTKIGLVILGVILTSLISSITYGYSVDTPVHQHIANESRKIWSLIPYEIKNHLVTPVNQNLDGFDYQEGEDIITGSGEEDKDLMPPLPYTEHFWDPDNPQDGNYNDGLDYLGYHGSSYRRALNYWRNHVIQSYLNGNIDESYYWLGRVAHLIQDATVPAHIHNDEHINGDTFEDYASTVFSNYNGTSYEGEQYYYEELNDINWENIDSNDKQFIELFRLFWYTAQKTQYYASDDYNGNSVYYDLNDQQQSFTSSLWQGEDVDIISGTADVADNLDNISDAVIPHAMKATAGLYRLFWDTVHSYSWPTYHHDNRRTGFTLLKGDTSSTSVKKGMNLVLSGGIASDAVARPSIADIDGNGRQDVIVTYTNGSQDHGWVARLEKSKYLRRTVEKWDPPIHVDGPISAPPSIGDTDTDEDGLETVIALQSDGKIIALDEDGNEKWTYQVDEKYSAEYGDYIRGETAYTAIADVDLDGKAEIIFTDFLLNLEDWTGELYIIEDDGNNYGTVHTKDLTASGDGGAMGAVAIANVDSDNYSEIVVPGFYGIKVFDYDGSTITQKCSTSHGKIIGAPVIYDIDRDNEYEIIYTTADYTCGQGTCYNKLYVINASSCSVEGSVTTGIYSLVAPAIANLDGNGNPDIIIQGGLTESGYYDVIAAYDGDSLTVDWSYPSSGGLEMIDVAPNIADINGDGEYEVIAAKESDEVLILNHDGTLYKEFFVEGEVGSSPVIGDLSGKGVAELAVKRAGSPLAIFTMLTGNNSKPELDGVANITAIAGNLININESGLLSASDPDGDQLTFYYSSPFNESGLWQSTINDSGNYSILVEASDGNLSDYQYAELIVFEHYSNVTDTFADGTSKKSLSFTGGENQTVQIRLPKNASILYSKIKIEGST